MKLNLPEYTKTKYWCKSYPKGFPSDVTIPRVGLPQLIEDAVRENHGRVAMLYGGEEITYDTLGNQIGHFASALYALGVTKGQTVALFLPNCPQFAIAYYGALKIGAMVTALSPLFMTPEVDFQLKDSRAQTLVIHAEFWPRVEPLLKSLPLCHVIVVAEGMDGFSGPPSMEIRLFDNLLGSETAPAPPVAIDPGTDVAALQYTGGTTGRPKAAMLTHQNIVANIVQNRPYWVLIEKKDGVRRPVVMSVLPWYHIYGQTVDLSTALCLGGTLVVLPHFEAELVLRTIQETRAHVFMGVSTMFLKLLNEPDLGKYDLTSLKWCNNGATIIPSETVKEFEKVTGVRIVEGYGLSEASPVTHTTTPYLKRKIGAVGPPIPNTLQAIIDPETCEFLPLGESGEVIVHGPQVMKGYWGRRRESEDVFLWVEGLKWLRTGDIGQLDEDGYLTIVDRSKELIKYKGHSVYPSEVEEVLYQHPAVSQAAVIGVPDPIAGENIKAFVVLREDFDGILKEEELIQFVRERLAAYKYPRAIEFRSDIPKSPVGKILRRVLRDEALKTSSSSSRRSANDQ
ncbi:MAG: long-chain fatty acid--CoA ligase [Pseudomonadota bacterium]